MKPSRPRTLLIGVTAGVAYAFLLMLLVDASYSYVSITYIFVLPVILGAIPVLFSTKEQLESYWMYLLLPWGITGLFFSLCFIGGFEGMICLVIIFAPFVLLGTLGAFLARLSRLKNSTHKTPLYSSLFLPLVVLLIESSFQAKTQFYTVSTTVEITAEQANVWETIKNVKNIGSTEIATHFIHLIGIPKPLDGRLDQEGVGGIRHITWEKGIRFQEIIKTWDSGNGFTYDIQVDPASIPPTTLDEHVMIGGRYFDVVQGSYQIKPISPTKNRLTLSCRYRITTNLNFYGKWWADYILNDFNEMILEVIKSRCEADK